MVVLLQSKSFLENTFSSLNDLRLHGRLTDITIKVDFQGKAEEFRAHQLMLAASSGYFKSIVLSEHWIQDKVLLTNMQTTDFAKFLEFVYTGKIQVSWNELVDVQLVAKFLDCQELFLLCKETREKASRKLKKLPKTATTTTTTTTSTTATSPSTTTTAEKENENNPRRSKRKKKSKKMDSDDGDYTPTSEKTPGTNTFSKTLKLRLPRKVLEKTTEPEKEETDGKEEGNGEAETGNDEPKKSKNAVPSDEEWSPKDNTPNGDEDDDAFLLGFEGQEPSGDDSLGEEVFKWTSKAQFECTECQRTFHYEKSFLKHRSTYHGVTAEIVHRCEICQQTFANRSNLKTHERHVHSSERLFTCTTCTKSFKRKKDVVRHQRQVHERDSHKHICSTCGKSLSCKAALHLHERIHNGTKPFQCPVCDAKFTQKTALKMHNRTHTGEKPFACTLCAARFTQKQMLANHVRSHTGEKPFMCEACGKSFSSREYLRHHSNIHTGAKPFKCERCGRGFSQRNSLNQHLKIHTGERPYSCKFCEKQFTQLNALQRHQRIHTGEKPFMCSMCHRTFTDKSTLRRHTTTHASDAPWTSFLVVLDGNIEDRKPPAELKNKSPKTVDKRNKKSTNREDNEDAKNPTKSETTETSTITVPSDWASHGAIALVSHTALGGITVIHTEIPAGTKLQPIVTTDSTGASVLSLDNSAITVPFSIAANVAQSISTTTIPTVSVSDGTLAIVTDSQTISTPSVLEVAASQTILASESDSKANEEDMLAPNVETEVVMETTAEIEVNIDAKDDEDDDEQNET